MNFIALYQALDTSQSTQAKKDALVAFIGTATGDESARGIGLLLGHPLPNRLPTGILKQCAVQHHPEAPWLFEACYAAVGDLAETLAILLANPAQAPQTTEPVLSEWDQLLGQLKQMPPDLLADRLTAQLASFARDEAFLFLKLSTRGLRVGVSRGVVHDALARVTGLDRAIIDERMMGTFQIHADWLSALNQPATAMEIQSQPVPFLLALSWTDTDQARVRPEALVAEYKWDGIRCQLIKSEHLIRLWSRGDHDITTQFPEVVDWAKTLPSGLILDGELLVMHAHGLGSFQDLQTRLNRKRVTPQLRASHPVIFRPYDCLRFEGRDLRATPWHQRRQALDSLAIKSSPIIEASTWEALALARDGSRAAGAEGLMLKHRDGLYLGGRKPGLWWKWKLDPMTADCVLLYARAGHGRRASLHTDYTLGAWRDHTLVPVTQAYSGLTDQALKEIDRWIRKHTLNRYGPVREVTPELVFEIAFEGIARSNRHKSGLALRFPRIIRWRQDVTIEDADHLSHFERLLSASR